MYSIFSERFSHESNNFTEWRLPFRGKKNIVGTYRIMYMYAARLKNASFVAKLDENSPSLPSTPFSFSLSIFQSNHACIVTQNYSQIRLSSSKSISCKSNGFRFIMDSGRYEALGGFIHVLRGLNPLLDSVWQRNWWDEVLRDRSMPNAWECAISRIDKIVFTDSIALCANNSKEIYRDWRMYVHNFQG